MWVDDGGMRAALRLPDHERAVEELETLAREHAEIHEAVILDPPPAAHLRLTGGGSRGGHRGKRSATAMRMAGKAAGVTVAGGVRRVTAR